MFHDIFYTYKWTVFTTFASTHHLPALPTSLEVILHLLLHLFHRGLPHSTLKAYIAAIVAHQPQGSEATSLFRHPTLKQFLHGLKNIRSAYKTPTPQWSLQLVLNRLMRPSFELLATSSEKLPTLKTVFLVAIISAHRASEFSARFMDLPFLQFHPDTVTHYPDLTFLLR